MTTGSKLTQLLINQQSRVPSPLYLYACILITATHNDILHPSESEGRRPVLRSRILGALLIRQHICGPPQGYYYSLRHTHLVRTAQPFIKERRLCIITRSIGNCCVYFHFRILIKRGGLQQQQQTRLCTYYIVYVCFYTGTTIVHPAEFARFAKLDASRVKVLCSPKGFDCH